MAGSQRSAFICPQVEMKGLFKAPPLRPLLGGVSLLLSLLVLATPAASLPVPKEPFVALAAAAADAPVGYTLTECDVCKIVFYVFDAAFQANQTEKEVAELAQRICVFFKIEDITVCHDVVLEFEEQLFEVILKEALSPEQACGFLIGTTCSTPYRPNQNWTITLPDVPKPPIVPPKPPTPGSPTVRVMHISDLHYDTQYVPGANANCGEPLCCRSSDGIPSNKSDGAWKFGDYRGCDTPLSTIESMFEHAAENGKFDVIYWTGDLPAHNVWNQSRAEQVSLVKDLTLLLLQYFPDKMIFAAVGNHESSPVNSFPQPFVSGDEAISWLYDALATSWVELGLPLSQQDTVAYGAFYVAKAFPGLRVVSLNMNYCTFGNWWLYINATDPAGMLKWLVNQLDSAEQAGDKVHIIGHHHPSDCFAVWGNNYRNIVNRYESTIAGQFFGHSHTDSYEVFYENGSSRPFSVAYSTPSVTAYSGLNSGYRIFTMDGSYSGCTWVPLDHETYILDLQVANLVGKAVWELEYSARAAFGLKDMLPQSWEQLTFLMAADETVFNLYYRLYFKSNMPSEQCDASCRHSVLCETMTVVDGDASQCSRLSISRVNNGGGDAVEYISFEKSRRVKRSLC